MKIRMTIALKKCEETPKYFLWALVMMALVVKKLSKIF